MQRLADSSDVERTRPHLSNRRVYQPADWTRLRQHLNATWQQGEHVSIIGPTGCGKTTLASQVLDVRGHVVVLVTKVYDDTLTSQFPGYERIEKWPPPKNWTEKVLLWPTVADGPKWWDKVRKKKKSEQIIRATFRKQRDIFQHALDNIFTERNWCVVFDEQHYVCKQLGLETENAMILQQGRSSGLSVVNGTQRPAWVPVVTYSSATHSFIWRTTDRTDLQRLGELGGIDQRELAANLLRLDPHEFVYVNSRRGDIVRSQVR